MISNFLKTALRNVWKMRGYSFLNIFGLAIGITAASLIFLWVENQLNFNDNFENKKDIYLVKSKHIYNGSTYVMDATSGLLGPVLSEEIPGIKHVSRVSWETQLSFANDDNILYQKGLYADKPIADILSLNFSYGDPKHAFDDLNNIILTESSAEKLFGSTQILGKSIKINNDETYIVSGVIKDLPKNCDYTFEWLIPFKKYETTNDWLKSWNNNGVKTLLQIEPNANVHAINIKIEDIVKHKSNGNITHIKNFIYPMERWVTYNSFDSSGNEIEGGIKNIRLFTIIAWIVIFIACINFTNLATARSQKRAKEVGMRKVIGATRKSLIFQFLSESLLLTIFSTLLSLLLLYLLINPFNQLIEQELSVDTLKPTHLLFIVFIIFTCSILAGTYPAFFLSSFKPLSTIKGGKIQTGQGNFIRKTLVIIQYTASIVLIICTVIIYKQIQFNKNKELGFEKSHVVTTPLQGSMRKRISAIKNDLKATEFIEEIGLGNSSLLSIHSNSPDFYWPNKDPNSSPLIARLNADEGLIPTMSLKLLHGRNFNPNLVNDSTSIIINETLAKLIQKDGLIAGSNISYGDVEYQVVGVVKDFFFNNVYANPEPLVIFPINEETGVLNIKTKPNVNLSETIAVINHVINKHNPGFPFEYTFLDETFNNKFKSELFVQKLASSFAVISIIISCLGLFGLAAFETEQRAKEISIRKILGASTTKLMLMLNKDFIVLVITSCLIAFPIAWYIMNLWLQNFSHHVNISWLIFAGSGITAILIAVFTISSNAIKTVLSNPTKILRDE